MSELIFSSHAPASVSYGQFASNLLHPHTLERSIYIVRGARRLRFREPTCTSYHKMFTWQIIASPDIVYGLKGPDTSIGFTLWQETHIFANDTYSCNSTPVQTAHTPKTGDAHGKTVTLHAVKCNTCCVSLPRTISLQTRLYGKFKGCVISVLSTGCMYSSFQH